jgi:hypothetical protein
VFFLCLLFVVRAALLPSLAAALLRDRLLLLCVAHTLSAC